MQKNTIDLIASLEPQSKYVHGQELPRAAQTSVQQLSRA